MSKTAFPAKVFFLTAVLGLAATVFSGCAESNLSATQATASKPVGKGETAQEPVYDASLVRVQKVYGEGASVGQPYEFQILVTALKPTANVLIRQMLPESVDFLSAYPQAELDDSGSPVWDLGALAQGDQRTLNLVVVPSQLGNFSFRTTVKAQPVAVAAEAPEVVRVGAPDLSVDLQGPSAVDLGESVTWKLLVTNNGSTFARHVRLSSVLPSGFEVSGDQAQSVSRLLPGQSTQLTVNATPTEAGLYSANFTAAYDGGAPIQRQAQVLVRNAQARVVVSGPAAEYIFSPATYTLTVINTGGTALQNVTLVNDLPKGAVLYGEVTDGGEVFSRTDVPGGTRKLELRTEGSASGYWQEGGNPLRDDSAGQVQWVIEQLEPGQSATREITYYATEPGSPENHARVITSRGLSARSATTTQWKGIPGIYTSLVDSADPIRVGEKVTYTITVGNQSREGTIAVQTLEVRLPDVLRLESGSEGGSINGNTAVFSNIELGPQEKKELTLNAVGERLGTGVAVMKTTTSFHGEALVNEQSISVY